MMKVIRYLVLALFLSGGGALLWQYQARKWPVEAERVRNQDLVRQYYREELEQVKAENKTELILPSDIQLPTNVNSLEQVIQNYSLVRVKVKDAEVIVTQPDTSIEVIDIKTWYKLEVLEGLHQQRNVGEEPLPEGVPKRLLPLLPSEGFLFVQGGTVTVDGIKVIRSFGTEDVPLALNGEYLIAADLVYGNKHIHRVTKAGLFLIDDTSLKPVKAKDSQIAREIEEKYGNSLIRLRSDPQLRKAQER
jgi:hypothetical protein